ncbi:MAG: hypothetical protein ACOYN0_02510 [Phycisphaerales bacterium]
MSHTSLLTVAVLSAAASTASAQFAIDWYTIDCGGGTSSGGAFQVSGTIGQFDAGAPMTGGGFTVTGGFWAGAGGSVPSCPWQVANCAADYDNSTGVDSDDVIAFFGDWDAGATCADVDASGGADSDDVILFFSLWDAGGC